MIPPPKTFFRGDISGGGEHGGVTPSDSSGETSSAQLSQSSEKLRLVRFSKMRNVVWYVDFDLGLILFGSVELSSIGLSRIELGEVGLFLPE